MFEAVAALAPRRAPWFREDPDALVVSNRLRLASGASGEDADRNFGVMVFGHNGLVIDWRLNL